MNFKAMTRIASTLALAAPLAVAACNADIDLVGEEGDETGEDLDDEDQDDEDQDDEDQDDEDQDPTDTDGDTPPEGDTGDTTEGNATDGGDQGDAGDEGQVEDDGGDTGQEPPVFDGAPEDGDSEANPAVFAQFRATSPAPIAVDGPLFNVDPIDTRGLEYSEEVSFPGDSLDVVHFRIVPGLNSPTIRVALDCDDPAAAAGRLLATVRKNDAELVQTITCGSGTENVFLNNATSLDTYSVQVEMLAGSDLLQAYSLGINGFCFQQCNFVPLDG